MTVNELRLHAEPFHFSESIDLEYFYYNNFRSNSFITYCKLIYFILRNRNFVYKK